MLQIYQFSYTNLFNNKLYVQVTNAKQYRCKGAQRHQQLANLLRYSMKKKKQRRRFHASCQLSIKLLKSVDSCHPHFKLCVRVWHDLCSMCLFNNSISTLNMNVTSFGLHCISNNFNYSPSNFPHITLSSRRFFFQLDTVVFFCPDLIRSLFTCTAFCCCSFRKPFRMRDLCTAFTLNNSNWFYMHHIEGLLKCFFFSYITTGLYCASHCDAIRTKRYLWATLQRLQ